MSQVQTAQLRRTPLLEVHHRASAKIIAFEGWEMPVEYEGVRVEHLAVRNTAGIFDVSHMGEIETRGPQALDFLQTLMSNNLSMISEWGAQYTMLCTEDGGVIDDLITYRLPDEGGEQVFLSVVNAANTETDLNWLSDHAASWDDVKVSDVSDEYAMIALQGPKAPSILRLLWDGGDPEDLGRFRSVEAQVAGVEALVCHTGYTGEEGVEFLLAPEDAENLWSELVEEGAKPIGLGARDTLRLEVCYPLYGNELSLDRTPIEAGLKWCCALDKDFIGVEAIQKAHATGPKERLVALKIVERGIPRAGCAVLHEGRVVGEVTSGTLSPSLGEGVGMAYIESELTEPGTAIDIDIRGKVRQARVVPKPLYKKP